MKTTFFIKTFGCQQNTSDSERIKEAYMSRGFKESKTIKNSDIVVINTCMVKQSAENRVYGLVNNLSKRKEETGKPKIVVTGCMVGLAVRDKSNKYMDRLKKIMPLVDEFLPIEEVGYDHEPIRSSTKQAYVPISNGCNNFCSFCVVPFTRGKEISRPLKDILLECVKLKNLRYESIILLGQNVNSYGADIIKNRKDKKITLVKHLGRYRIPTLFPYLLNKVAKLGFRNVSFMSSNPWDFSDDLIKVIKENKNINREIHLPVQSGDNQILKKMNRWYTRKEYIDLVKTIRKEVKNASITTDIIVGFPSEDEKAFQNTVNLAEEVGFTKAYISKYSSRPFTHATKNLEDDISPLVKKKRWLILDRIINRNKL